MSGYTRKEWPCPGCGVNHHSHDLCQECPALIALGKATLVARQPANVRLYRTHALHRGPSYYVAGDYTARNTLNQANAPISAAMLTLLTLLREPDEDISYKFDSAGRLFEDESRDTDMQGWPIYLRQAYREALNTLHQAIRASLLAHYEFGVRRGGSLLGALARNEITVAALNAATLTQEEA